MGQAPGVAKQEKLLRCSCLLPICLLRATCAQRYAWLLDILTSVPICSEDQTWLPTIRLLGLSPLWSRYAADSGIKA